MLVTEPWPELTEYLLQARLHQWVGKPIELDDTAYKAERWSIRNNTETEAQKSAKAIVRILVKEERQKNKTSQQVPNEPRWHTRLRLTFRLAVLVLLLLILFLLAQPAQAQRRARFEIQDEGSRLLLCGGGLCGINYAGAGVVCAPPIGNIVTCTITGAAGGSQHQIDGVNLTSNDPINFLDTTKFDWTNPAAGDLSLALKAGFVSALVDFSSTLCGTNEILEDQGASWACIATPAGGTTRWDQLIDPTAVTVFNSGAIAELYQLNYTAAYGATDVLFDIEQLTGNPVAGSVLFKLTAADPDIRIFEAVTTANSATEILHITVDPATPANGDEAQIAFRLDPSGASAVQTFGRIDVALTDVTEGAEVSALGLDVWDSDGAGTMIEGFNLIGRTGQDEAVINTSQVDLDFRVAAVGVANALFVRGSNGKVGIREGVPKSLVEITGTLNALADLAVEENYFLKLHQTGDTDGQGVGISFGMSSTDDQQTAAIVSKRTGGNGQGTLQFYTKQSTLTGVAPVLVLALNQNGNVGIGVETPATSAILELVSTTGALLPTRLTTAERDALTPVDGMMLYNSTLARAQSRVSAAWESFSLDTTTPTAADISGSLSAGYTIDAGAVASAELATANKTITCNITLFRDTGLKDTDDLFSVTACSRPGRALTITVFICECDAGSPIVNAQRDDGTPANILTSDLTCTTSGATGTLDATEKLIAATDRFDFVAVSGMSGANQCSMNIQATVD